MASGLPEVLCRPIDDGDFEAVVACLQRGFPDRPRRYWEHALETMARRPAINDYPRYGNALFVDGNVVGVLVCRFFRDATPQTAAPFAATFRGGALTRNTGAIR